MSHSYRPLLVPAVAMATAGVVALAPAVVAPPVVTVASAQIPVVQVHEVQLAGIGQDIYEAISAWVQYGVEVVQYGVSLIPFIGGGLSEQIEIIYFDTFQPAVQETVDFLAAVVQDPFNLIGETTSYLNQLYGLAYNFVASELAFFGFPPLPPIPPRAASVSPMAGLATIGRTAPPAAATVVEDVAAEFGAGEVVTVQIGAPTEPAAEAEPEAAAVSTTEAVSAAEVEAVVEAESAVEVVAVPEPAETPMAASQVEADAVSEIAAPLVEPVVGDIAAPGKLDALDAVVDRPTRAARGEGRSSGKPVRVGRAAAE